MAKLANGGRIRGLAKERAEEVLNGYLSRVGGSSSASVMPPDAPHENTREVDA